MKLNALLKKFIVALGPGDTYNQWLDDVRVYEESPRHHKLQRILNYYLGRQYDDRKSAWDGHSRLGRDKAQATQLGMLTGVAAPYGQAPCYLKVPYVQRQIVPGIVRRLTGLLFGENLQPQLSASNDDGQPFVEAVLRTAEWYRQWADARNLGGGGGSVAVGVAVVDGTPRVEIAAGLDCDPIFKGGDIEGGILEGIRICYQHEVTRVEYTTDTLGRSIPKTVVGIEWFCRVITDRISLAATSPDGKEWNLQGDVIEHGLGCCPWVWIRNEPILNEVDGNPDVSEGARATCEQIDYILSQGGVGVRVNCDPTMVLNTREEHPKIQTGSQTVLVLGPDDKAAILETKGDGGRIALEYAAGLKDAVLEDSRCVLDEGRATGRSATEMVKRTESMHEHAADLRVVYGPPMERLFKMLLKILRGIPKSKLPANLRDLEMPETDDVNLTWNSQVQMSAQEKFFQIQGVVLAIGNQILSRQTARATLASSLGISDVVAEAELVKAEMAIYGAPGANVGKAATGNPGTPPAAPGVPTPDSEAPSTGEPFRPAVEGVWRDFLAQAVADLAAARKVMGRSA